MSKFFYQKLALNNIKKNSKMYIPYIFACIGTIMMFYNMSFLTVADSIGIVSDSASLRVIMYLGAIVIGIFSTIFLFYTNSFLIKQRKKEFGLFNVLGMEKKHVAKIMFYETLITAAVAILAGILSGILLSKLIILFLFKLISIEAVFGFEIPATSVLVTVLLFSGIFVINLAYNIHQVHLSNPVELLKGGKTGEKEPKTKWIIALVGIITLASGYYIAITVESPLAALNLFFIAVLLVMVGTYCLFTAGSIAVLKMLRNNKKYYYNPKHFISVSGMMYRMKQNAAGLANICILSTAVIIMISSTISLYVGVEDALRSRFQRNIIVSADNVSEEQSEELDWYINMVSSEYELEQKNIVRYRSMNVYAVRDGAVFMPATDESYASDNFYVLIFMTQDEYNKLEGRSVSLEEGEALVFSADGDVKGKNLDFNGYKLSVKEYMDSFDSVIEKVDTMTYSSYVVVDNMNTIEKIYNLLNTSEKKMEELSYFYGFDTEADENYRIEAVKGLKSIFEGIDVPIYAQSVDEYRNSFYSLYGGLFFLGIFLGLLFIMATVLIIYYKQLAEGYDDRERFEIMQKVGMSSKEVRDTIKNQVLSVFFLPLLMTAVHIAFSFKVITRLLAIFNLTNVPLFAVCTSVTIIIFSIMYALVYKITARTYYKIVSR